MAAGVKKALKPGVALESRTRELLNLFPGAQVSGETLILGKKVDAFCTLPGHLAPSFRIAVECKEWTRPLTRKQCVEILFDYNQIVAKGYADQFLLVTVHGIVPNAKELFDGRQFAHLSIDGLSNKLLDPTRLIDNARSSFIDGDLVKFYQPPLAWIPPLRFTSDHYDLIYNDFIDFVISLGGRSHLNLKWLSAEWLKYAGDGADRSLIHHYTVPLFERCVAARSPSKADDLETAVFNWIGNQDTSAHIAILGSYGTGKSSFAKRVAHRCANSYALDNAARVPFLIELKEFGSHQDIRGLITHELVNRHGISNGAFETFQTLNRSGRFIVILDGFDEMKQGMTLDSLLFNFNQLSLLAQGAAKILLCGRPTLFENNAEQNALLGGTSISTTGSAARYIQIEIAPLSPDAVGTVLLEYTKVRCPSILPRVETFVSNLRNLAKQSRQQALQELVSRPVHLPMLVSLLQRRRVRPRDINRTLLYRDFIDAIIERETIKRHQEFQSIYPSQVRRQFARDLAVEMWKIGEQRSIRIGEIPNRLITPLVSFGRSLDAIRRDLIAACFFDRKPPDILFSPHKSFLEFLVAEFIVINIDDPATLGESGLPYNSINSEIANFAIEMLTEEQWPHLLHPNPVSRALLKHWIDAFRREKVWISQQLTETILKNINTISSTDLERIISTFETKQANMFESKLIQQCLHHFDDLVAVHAFRALEYQATAPTRTTLFAILGAARFFKWLKSGWFVYPKVSPDLQMGKAVEDITMPVLRQYIYSLVNTLPRNME